MLSRHHRPHVSVLIWKLLSVYRLLGELLLALVTVLAVGSSNTLVHFLLRTARRFIR